MAENKDNIKQGALSSKDLSRGVRIQIAGLSGTFKDARFEDGVSKEPVSPATQQSLRRFFGDTVVKEVKAPKPQKGDGGKQGEAGGEGGSASTENESAQ